MKGYFALLCKYGIWFPQSKICNFSRTLPFFSCKSKRFQLHVERVKRQRHLAVVAQFIFEKKKSILLPFCELWLSILKVLLSGKKDVKYELSTKQFFNEYLRPNVDFKGVHGLPFRCYFYFQPLQLTPSNRSGIDYGQTRKVNSKSWLLSSLLKGVCSKESFCMFK